tara:strand:+ start:195 stop:380 length:186 start_codon:yes stop_codon:yes gene_type:complete
MLPPVAALAKDLAEPRRKGNDNERPKGFIGLPKGFICSLLSDAAADVRESRTRVGAAHIAG